MRKWLALVVLMVLLVTAGPRLVAVQEQAGALRQAVVEVLEGNNVQAQAVWDQVCNTGGTWRSEFACLGLFLSTEGESGYISHDLEQNRVAMYARGFGHLAQEGQAIGLSLFSYQLSLELAPNRYTAYRLTNLLREQGREAEVIAVLNGVAATLSAGASDHWWALGEVAYLSGDWNQAAVAFGHGAQLAEDPYNLWMRQGEAFRRLRNWAKAELAYSRGSWIRPVYPVPYRMLGSLHRLQDETSQSARWSWMTLQLNPEDVSSNYNLAQALYQAGELNTAVTYLADALDLHSGRPWRWAIELGDWRLALGDREGALETYRQALEWQPGEVSIEDRIEQALEARTEP